MKESRLLKTACFVLLLCAATASVLPAQTFTTLVNFNGTDGSAPVTSLVQGFDGKLYGTTIGGGTSSYGTFFKITPAGALTTLHNFTSAENGLDTGPVVTQATDGNFYGTSAGGGNLSCSNGCGIVFQMTPAGTLNTLYSFCAQAGCTDGYDPKGGLIQGADGNFYGTTSGGGANGYGTVFKITSGGSLTTLHSFDDTDGAYPIGGLVQVIDGDLYGTASEGGANSSCNGGTGCGTVFEITPGGTLTTLYNFCAQANCTDGYDPEAGLVQATDGNLYGTTSEGGIADCFMGGTCGTAFQITPDGTLTTLHSFDGSDGDYPLAPLVQGTDGNLYGTTYNGGTSTACAPPCGNVFMMTLEGSVTNLFSFDFSDGAFPVAGLLQATNGSFYGTTAAGGTDSGGTLFSLSGGLGPFVETLPTAGPVGTAVIILGYGLTSASAVSFNGTAATFTVVSDTEITTTVPSGATTGTVQVTTSNGTLNSNVPFVVTPTWQQVPGLFSQISVGCDGTVWGLNSAGQIYMFNSQTQTWQQVPGLLAQIAVGSSSFVFGLNGAGQIYRYDASSQGWDQIPGILSQLAVGCDGDLWGINSGAQVFHFNSGQQTWVQVPGALAQLAVGADGTVWGLNNANQIWRFNAQKQSWDSIAGQLTQISVGADAVVWGLDASGQSYEYW